MYCLILDFWTRYGLNFCGCIWVCFVLGIIETRMWLWGCWLFGFVLVAVGLN